MTGDLWDGWSRVWYKIQMYDGRGMEGVERHADWQWLKRLAPGAVASVQLPVSCGESREVIDGQRSVRNEGRYAARLREYYTDEYSNNIHAGSERWAGR
jgi:hypothetical protein